ncbi:HAMP domain-containing histidine kinase [Actinocorallia sp. API 0066]|uniref:sensor histidine kinase n=1 Tax=Actinocorallia sp. API 0066 TaxID=2896846 RepID=UPI001E3B57DD|nr:HAMP domain-containing sensor histidine kinase [Actinocorallia sp. API 0066]MCD0452978.1 HAMP domain-containing histidine kinase [Actinocorallia sp. API 0066]
MNWSIRTRLTVLAATVMALLCVAGSALIMLLNYGQAVNYRTEAAQSVALKTVHLIKRAELPRVIPRAVASHGKIQVVDARERVTAGTGTLGQGPRISSLIPPQDDTTATAQQCRLRGLTGCNIVVVFRVYEPDGDWYVYSFDETVPWYISDLFLGQLAAATVLLTALTALGTALVVGRALQPVEHIRRAAKEIGESVVDRRVIGCRIALPPHHDELRALAVTANEMLDRMEASIVREREFTSNASHDLRNPITAMRTEIDEALMYPDETDWPGTADRLALSVDRLQDLVEDLLALSRLDSGALGAREDLDLAELVEGELAQRPPDVRLETDLQPVTIRGDRIHLARLVTNLLDNAARHASRHIAVRVYPDGRDAVLEVENDGDTIPPDMRETVFERFTRLDASRTKDKGGSGLGLSIVREVALAHHGTATATAPQPTPGTQITIRLPRTP